MKLPFFTVITATYNSGKTLSRCIESVMGQTFTDFEFIVVDGNSSDDTLSIIRSFEPRFSNKGISYRYISEKDKGVYDAWNKGLVLSRGEWISFLGSDDEYLPDALERYKLEIGKCGDCNYVSSRVNLVNQSGDIINEFGEPFVWDRAIRDLDIAQVGSFHKRELFNEVGHFNSDYRIVGDLDFYLRSKDVMRPAHFSHVTAHMQNGGVSNQIYTALKEARDVKLKYRYTSAFNIWYYFYSSLVKSYIKRIVLNKK